MDGLAALVIQEHGGILDITMLVSRYLTNRHLPASQRLLYLSNFIAAEFGRLAISGVVGISALLRLKSDPFGT